MGKKPIRRKPYELEEPKTKKKGFRLTFKNVLLIIALLGIVSYFCYDLKEKVEINAKPY